MENKELAQIFSAILLMFIVSGAAFAISGKAFSVLQVFVFSFIVVGVPVIAKNIIAFGLDASVEHKTWGVYNFGFGNSQHFKEEQPFGVYIPIIFSVLTLGFLKVMTFLTYETRALKYRAAKRFGFYSYTEITDWHNGLIGASGVIVLWIIAAIGYLPGWEFLAKMASYYAFWNMIPVSDLDGTQIFFGSRVLWVVMAIITLVFCFYALVL